MYLTLKGSEYEILLHKKIGVNYDFLGTVSSRLPLVATFIRRSVSTVVCP